MNNKKNLKQISLFPRETNLVSREEYLKTKKPVQHERALMADIMKAARSLGLPCVHIEYYCGNKFYATCESCKVKRKLKHAPIIYCPDCHKPVLVQCHNTLNKKNSGHFDIIGIGWTIETKHKVNKGKQTARQSARQEIKKEMYDLHGIPNLTINEDNSQSALNFLLALRDKMVLEKNKCKICGAIKVCPECDK